jgi:hypothetical protein
MRVVKPPERVCAPPDGQPARSAIRTQHAKHNLGPYCAAT